jgi:contractile injection system tube protein
MRQQAPIALINLVTNEVWMFQFFPEKVSTEDKTNWELQNVTIGTKPLGYANREPQKISISDVFLDDSDQSQSIERPIQNLRSLMSETEAGQPPPTLRFICGSWQERVVLESLNIEREMFNADGDAIRARISMTLIQVAQNERTEVQFTDPFSEEATFSPLGNF